MSKSYVVVRKPMWWHTTKLYLYWCYNYNEMKYKVGPIGDALLHKFIFKESEIEEMRQKHPDFDKVFSLEDAENASL